MCQFSRRDVSECDENLKCAVFPRTSSNKGVLVSDLTSGHYSCYYGITYNDGQYETIAREDETDLDILSRKVQIKYTSITECNTTDSNTPGLMCGETCLQQSSWCWENTGSSCGKYNFSTNNKQLCG